jgi:hypothetical protein
MIAIVAPDPSRNRPRKTRLGGAYDYMRSVIATELGGALYREGQSRRQIGQPSKERGREAGGPKGG